MSDTLKVNVVFSTIQGEATHAGRPAVFIRLQGCPVGCPWCDTRFTWAAPADVMEIAPGDVLIKAQSGTESWAAMETETLVDLVSRHRARHVVLTGGEPCLYDLLPLTTALLDSGYSVQIETSGTQLIRADSRTWVTVSPKLNMPGGFPVRQDALARADEIKMPIGKPDDLQALFALLENGSIDPDVPIWLQPLSMSTKATELCRVAAMANNFRISLQLHAYAGWR